MDELPLDLNNYGRAEVENMTDVVGELWVVVINGDSDEPLPYQLSAVLLGGNRPPVAEAGQDISANVGEYVHLDGTGSHDPDGDELSYSWDFDASDGIGADAAGPTADTTCRP